ncbi:MAG TPA: sugar ABC transporter substrate-binding protein [Trueperaceae bacterium]
MNRFARWSTTLAALCLAALALAQADPAELAARQADPANPFWNPGPEQLAAWHVIDDVEDGATLTFWTMSLSPTFDPYLQQVVTNFEATYPGVDVTWQDVPWDGLQAKLRNGFTAGNPPDVANISPAWIAEFAGAGLLEDLDAAMAPYPELRDQYVDTAWTTGAYEGTSYQIPWYLGLSNFLGYNKALLEKHGYSVSDLPHTWTELRDFARDYKEKTGTYATSLNFGAGTEQYLLTYLLYNDIEIDPSSGPVNLATPEAIDALQVWVDLVQDNLVPLASLTDDHRQMIDRFSQGDTALVIIAPQLLRLVKDNNPDVYANLGVTQGITGSSGASGVDVQSLVIAKDTPYPNAALALAQFVTNAETQAEFGKWAGVYPSNLQSYADPYYQSSEGGQLPEIRPLAEAYVKHADNRLVTFPNDAEVQQAVVEATQAALLGQKSAEEALTWLTERINTITAGAQ